MLIDLPPSAKKWQCPRTEDEREEQSYKLELDLLEEEAEQKYSKNIELQVRTHLKTRTKEFLYDAILWSYLTIEEQRERETSYGEFYIRIVGENPAPFEPRPLSVDVLLQRRQRYKRSFRYLFEKLFHKHALKLCTDESLPGVLELYGQFLNILEDLDQRAYAEDKSRFEASKKDLFERWDAFREKRKKKYEAARAQREGRQKLAWSAIETEDSWDNYLLGVRTGNEYESAIWRVLDDLGYKCSQTKASGDQGVDLLLTFGGRRIAIQCKYYMQPVGNAAIQEVFAGKTYYNCDEAWVITNSTYTSGAVSLAHRTDVVLLHHTDLSKVLLRDGQGLPSVAQLSDTRASHKPKKPPKARHPWMRSGVIY